MAAERWVAVRLSAMGDVVLTTGVLDFWHRKRGWRFVMVTREALAPIFKNHPAVDEVVCLDGGGYSDYFAERMAQSANSSNDQLVA